MLRAAGSMGAVGLEIALAIAVGFLGGEYLDRRWGTAPWLKWIGLVAGCGAAVKALIRVNRQYQKAIAEHEQPSATHTDDAPPRA